MHNVDNRKLIDGCRRNDRSAQRALYDTFAPMMFPVCLRYIGNEAEAEDVLIESFVTVFTHIGDVEKAKLDIFHCGQCLAAVSAENEKATADGVLRGLCGDPSLQ